MDADIVVLKTAATLWRAELRVADLEAGHA
jgi:hypothetical protein